MGAALRRMGAPGLRKRTAFSKSRRPPRRLAISTDTLYRKARELPFTVRIGGNVRFSAQGISRFIATRQGR